MTTRPFSKCLRARLGIKGSAMALISRAEMSLVGTPLFSKKFCRAIPFRRVASIPM